MNENPKGYIYLHRKLLDNPVVMKDADHLALWVYILMKANHSKRDVMFGKERITVERGQFITGRKVIAKDLGINESKVYRIIKLLKSEQQIEQRVNSTSSLITIVNYDAYQKVNIKVNNERTASEQRVNTTNKYNTYNTLNKNTHLDRKVPNQQVDDINSGVPLIQLFIGWVGKKTIHTPTSFERKILAEALKHNSDVQGFWVPLLKRRLALKASGHFVHSNMKAWFGGGFREMPEKGKEPKKKTQPQTFKTNSQGGYIAYCGKCGIKVFPNEFQLRAGSECCSVAFTPKPKNKVKNKRKYAQGEEMTMAGLLDKIQHNVGDYNESEIQSKGL